MHLKYKKTPQNLLRCFLYVVSYSSDALWEI